MNIDDGSENAQKLALWINNTFAQLPAKGYSYQDIHDALQIVADSVQAEFLKPKESAKPAAPAPAPKPVSLDPVVIQAEAHALGVDWNAPDTRPDWAERKVLTQTRTSQA